VGTGAVVAGDVGRRWSSGCLGTRNRLHNLLLTSVAAFAAGSVAARAADVDITTSTNAGVNLDTFVGTTARVFPGVTVDNTTPGDAIKATTQAWTVTNDGTVKGQNSINLTKGGAVTNSAGAQINGSLGGIAIGTAGVVGAGTVDNFGTVTATVDGIQLLFGGTVTNYQGASVTTTGSGVNGISVGQGASRTVINSGTIHADGAGFATGVLVQGGASTVTNNATGVITGGFNGVFASSSSPLTFTNAGSITSVRGAAVEGDGGGTYVNTGTIQSTNSDGMQVKGANPGIVTNSGTIGSAGAGRAIAFSGASAHTLNLLTGSVLNGNVQGGTGTDNLVLQGTGTESIAKFLSFETLSMQGSNWALTGTGAFTTSTTVTGGVLRINGQLTTPTVTVNAGGTIGGSGTIISNVTVNGNVAPGNSIGTLNVVGPYTQAAGSTYTVEVNPAGQSDLISVTGTATIQAGAGVNVVGAPGFYTLGQRYTILTATGGVTGQYTTLTDNLPFVDFGLASNANNIFLDVTRSSVSFQEIAQTRNQRASASGAEALGAGNKIFDSVVMLDAPNARRAFDLLSGEIHASVAGAVIEDSRFIRDAVGGRLRQSMGGAASIFAPQFATLSFGGVESEADAAAFDDDTAMAYASSRKKRIRDTVDRAMPLKAAPVYDRVFTAWGQAFGNFGRTDSDGNAAALHRTTGGFITGMDVTMPGSIGDVWRAGFAGGYQHTSVDVGDRSSSGGIDTYHLAAYGGRQIGALGLRAGASYGWHDISTSRSIVFPGFSDAVKGKYGANTAHVFGEVGYGVMWRQFAFEPFAGLAYVNLHTDSFVEAGGAATLAGSGGTTDTTYSTVGIRAAAPLPWRNLAGLVAKGSVGWRHAFGTVTPTAGLSFASGATPFVVAGVPIARDAAAVELGIEGRVWRNATLGLAYTGQIASQADDHGVNASFIQRF